MSMRYVFRHLVMLTAALASLPAAADKVEESVVHEAVERHLSPDTPLMQWVQDPARVDESLGDEIGLRETLWLGTIGASLTVLPILFSPVRTIVGVPDLPEEPEEPPLEPMIGMQAVGMDEPHA